MDKIVLVIFTSLTLTYININIFNQVRKKYLYSFILFNITLVISVLYNINLIDCNVRLFLLFFFWYVLALFFTDNYNKDILLILSIVFLVGCLIRIIALLLGISNNYYFNIVLQMIVLYLFKRFNKVNLYFEKRISYILVIINLSILYCNNLLLNLDINLDLKRTLLLPMGIIIIGIIGIIFRLEKNNQIKRAYHNLKAIESNNKIWYELYEELKIIKHDLKHKYIILNHYVDQEDYSAIKDFITKENDFLIQNPSYITTSNQIIDSIINGKISYAFKKGINVISNISVCDENKIDYYELSKLIGNLMDNAIENNNDKKYLNFTLFMDPKEIYISVENSTDNIKLMSKRTIRERGFGLKSIKKLVSKYDGEFNIDYVNGVCRVWLIIFTD